MQFAVTDERFAPLVSRGAQVAVRDTMRQVAEAIEVGRVRATDPEVCAHAIIGLTTSLASEFIHRRGRPAGEVADATVDFILHGLLAGVDVGVPLGPGSGRRASVSRASVRPASVG